MRGGGYGAGTPREGWDHATPYLLRILGDVWGADVTLVEAELTLADVVPADGRAARRRRRLPGRGPREGGDGRSRARRADGGLDQSVGTVTDGRDARPGTSAGGRGVFPRMRSAAFSASAIVGA